ncbi:MAG: hypothetical protein N3A65_06270 [candidate division WOR-3 bacterium]|nr:hypothetical protein [candidate division WOR-3 bacterium]
MDDKKIVIGDRILTRDELYQNEKEFRQERARLSFEENIKILVELQKLARTWGRKEDILIWNI